MIARPIIFFGMECTLICDGKCSKAWGVVNRPKVQLSDDEDDIEWLADDELPDAPVDPGTYEGGHAKPQNEGERLNKWCARECERSEIPKPNENFTLRDFSVRRLNQPWKHKGPQP